MKLMGFSRITIAAGVTALSCLLAACGGAATSGTAASPGAATGSPIQLGATNVITGSIASICKPISDGADAYFKSVNANGGVNGHPIQFTVLDDGYDPARAAANARKLVDQGMVGLVSGCGTANETAAQSVVKDRGVPQLGPFANLPFLDPPTKTYFATFPPYGLQDAATIAFALKKFGPGGVVHISQNIPGVDKENAIAQSATEKAGGKWLGTVFVDPKNPDYSPTALKVKDLKPDYVLFSTGTAQTGQVLLAMQQQNVAPAKMFLASSSSTDPVLLQTVKSGLNGKFAGVSSVQLDGSATESCVKAIHQYGGAGADTELHGVYGCSVAQVAVAALKKIKGNITADSFATALETLKSDPAAPAFGPVTFTSSDHSGVKQGTAYEVKDGKFVNTGKSTFP